MVVKNLRIFMVVKKLRIFMVVKKLRIFMVVEICVKDLRIVLLDR